MRTLLTETTPVEAFKIFKDFYDDCLISKLDEAMMYYISFSSKNREFSAKRLAEIMNENPTENYIEILTVVHLIRHDYLINEILQKENKRLYIIQLETKRAIENLTVFRLIEDDDLKISLKKAEEEWREKERNCLNTIATVRALKDLINRFYK